MCAAQTVPGGSGAFGAAEERATSEMGLDCIIGIVFGNLSKYYFYY